ncbi:hypothetical protein CSIM01_00216 [Colletotrichum simmondsii]|uniref:Uncharacterized protein n=1 Tax=Colletotrichum simmondsii TaxID=703756 RepID=A0A135SML0_9PEZI|nr:hypothetical protein CSIM01_00216 [Colletotrichum simmondsii]
MHALDPRSSFRPPRDILRVSFRPVLLWRTLITSYTALDLTVISDRLPAIGGLAKLFFWDPDLDYEEDSRGLYEHYSTVLDCQVTPSGVDNYGGIAHGLLRISGLTVDGALERDTVVRNGKETTLHYVVVSTGRFRIDADYTLDSPGPDQVLPGADILCLKMSFIQDGPSDNFKLISLVLRESKQQPGKYERIGCFFIQSTIPPKDLQRSIDMKALVKTSIGPQRRA